MKTEIRQPDFCSLIPPVLNIFLLFIFLFVPFSASADTLGHEFLPLEHWSYKAFERFEILGLLNLPSEKPFSREQATEFVRKIELNLQESDFAFSRRDRFDLERLEKEFGSAASKIDPKERYDPPLLFQKDEPLFLESDVDVTLSLEKALFEDNKDVYAKGHPSLKLHFGRRATYDARYRVVFGPERGDRQRDKKPSPRERSWRGLVALFERSYIAVRFEKATLFFGREYTDWGPEPDGNLLVSRTAGSFDQVGARVVFRRFRLSFIHALLSPGTRRYLAGHRLETKVDRFRFGISETVVYTDREFDPIYMLPLASFYANQFNERGDDNVLWSLDVKFTAARGLLLYGSLLIDDLQYEREGAPDKLAFDFGAKAALTRPVPATVRMRYRYVDIYTYTHRDSMNAFITGNGNPREGDVLIGGEPGPDGDEWTAETSLYPRGDVTIAVFFLARRLGEGNDLRKWSWGMESFPPFPSGVVEKTIGFGASALWELNRSSSVAIELSKLFVENRGHVSGQDQNSYSFRLAVSWDL